MQAVRKGHWIVLDELNLAPTEVLEALNRCFWGRWGGGGGCPVCGGGGLGCSHWPALVTYWAAVLHNTPHATSNPNPSQPHPPRRLLDDNRELYVPELQEVVRPHPHFMLFATQNPPGIYAGRKTLSR